MNGEQRESWAPMRQMLQAHSPLLDWLIRPLILAAMVGCIAYAVVEFLTFILPVPGRYFVAMTVTGGAAGYYVHQLTRVLIPSEAERWQLRFLLLALSYLSVKAAGYVGTSFSAIVADVRSWLLRPYEFFDASSMAAFLFFTFAWVAAANTSDDFERIGVPTEDRDEIPPLLALSARFFIGGAILLVAAGLARVGIASLLNLARPSVPGLIFNVLLYFALGLILLGQTRLLTLFSHWRSQHIEISGELASRWLRYSLIFLGVVALVAFLLPTGYTVPLLDLANAFLWLLWLIAAFVLLLFNLLLLPIAWLMSLFMGDPIQRPDLSVPPPGQMPFAEEGGGLPPWIRLLRSLVFWGVILWIFVTLIRNYLREHPQLVAAVRSVRLWRLLRRWLDAIRQWLRGVGDSVGKALPRLGLGDRLRQVRQQDGPFRGLRPRPTSPRERVLREYLRTLERAAKEGLPRRPPQTPDEYRGTLEPELPKVTDDVSELTRAFVEARYSRHNWDTARVDRVRAIARQVRAALDQRGEKMAEDDE